MTQSRRSPENGVAHRSVTLDELYAHCGDLGLDVDWADLGTQRRGEYRDSERLIVLNRRMTTAQATAVLAHEIGHAVFGDRCSTPEHERRAWEYGAALVVSVEQYAVAEAMVGPHLGALAVELGVTRKLVEAWRRWHAKRWPLEQAFASGLEELDERT